MNISDIAIKQFLDSVDIVLNSNTFLVEFNIINENLGDSLNSFLSSDDFILQIAEQDKERNWYNMHYFDNKENSHKIKPGNILEENFELKISKPPFEKREYLIAMLTGDISKGLFFSFYNTGKNRNKAEIIIDEMVNYLSLYTGEWDLFTAQTDFLKSTSKSYKKGEDLRYFEGDYGNDTATIITYKDKGFLILTNGID